MLRYFDYFCFTSYWIEAPRAKPLVSGPIWEVASGFEVFVLKFGSNNKFVATIILKIAWNSMKAPRARNICILKVAKIRKDLLFQKILYCAV